MTDPLLLLLLAGVAALLLLIALLRPTIVEVDEEERLVVYRRGRFSRVVGPGWVLLFRRVEKIQRRLTARDAPKRFRTENLFIHGIPIGFTLNFWCRFNPVKAAGNDREKLSELAMFSDGEINEQIQIKVRDSLVSELARVEEVQRRKLAGDATIVDKILPVLPGAPDNALLLDGVRQGLEKTLPLVGVYFNPTHPITITDLIVSPEMIDMFGRNRIYDLLRMKFPDAPAELLWNMIAAIQGLDSGFNWDSLNLSASGTENAYVDIRRGQDGLERRVRVLPQPVVNVGDDALEVETLAVDQKEYLDENDLAYLKTVPQRGWGSQTAA